MALQIQPRTRLPLYRKPLYVRSGHALIPWKVFFQRGARSPRNQRRTRGILSTKTMADIRAPVPHLVSLKIAQPSSYVRSPRIDSRSRS